MANSSFWSFSKLASGLSLALGGAAFAAAQALPPMDPPVTMTLAPIAPGKFKGTMDSLRQNQYPKWFTDAKLGIWAHWGPQSVPMEGDWYARLLYEEGSSDYKDHLARYGHPSKFGYKDIIPLWHAEKWDPARLMKLYKAAGARYFVSMGVHHDNFDLWNSTYHRWNAVKMGPHRDIVATWQREAKKNGLKFGVSEHLGASWTWFQDSHGADKTGPMAGVPYDGADPAYQDLYHPKALPGDTGWYSTDPRWSHEWYRRIKDLVDNYKPDLLYSDGPFPFGDIGAHIVSNLYNINPQAVYTCKQASDGRWVQDVERGVLGGIQPYPWQTDTSIGDWFYNKHWKYRDAAWVLHTLIDVASKNGNLLINVVQRPDGSLDPTAEQVLADMTAWMKVNSESIYGTRPWEVFGEGPTRAKGGAFKEDFDFTAQDVRFAQKGGALYATLMGQPGAGPVTLVSLGKHAGDTSEVTGVKVLGFAQPIQWTQDENGLHLQLPSADYSSIATVIKVTGRNLDGFKSIPGPAEAPAVIVRQSDDGAIRLSPDAASLGDSSIQVETKDGVSNLGFWDNPLEKVQWTVEGVQPGTYDLIATVASGTPTHYFSDPITFAPGPWYTQWFTQDPAVPPTNGWQAPQTATASAYGGQPGTMTLTWTISGPFKRLDQGGPNATVVTFGATGTSAGAAPFTLKYSFSNGSSTDPVTDTTTDDSLNRMYLDPRDDTGEPAPALGEAGAYEPTSIEQLGDPTTAPVTGIPGILATIYTYSLRDQLGGAMPGVDIAERWADPAVAHSDGSGFLWPSDISADFQDTFYMNDGPPYTHPYSGRNPITSALHYYFAATTDASLYTTGSTQSGLLVYETLTSWYDDYATNSPAN